MIPAISRRFLVLTALLFWQGGFMFYSVVVVEVGGKVLGSHQMQGWITRSVTNYLNLSGATALVVWGWDIAATTDAAKRRRIRWALWAALVAMLGVLAWLHVHLHHFLDINSLRILDYSRFRFWHRCYLLTSTVQWAASFVLLAITLLAWRAEDRAIDRFVTANSVS